MLDRILFSIFRYLFAALFSFFIIAPPILMKSYNVDFSRAFMNYFFYIDHPILLEVELLDDSFLEKRKYATVPSLFLLHKMTKGTNLNINEPQDSISEPYKLLKDFPKPPPTAIKLSPPTSLKMLNSRIINDNNTGKNEN